MEQGQYQTFSLGASSARGISLGSSSKASVMEETLVDTTISGQDVGDNDLIDVMNIR
ncbi:MAG: hypothetical protein JJT76_07125 [Clostridiaceae bacterium]|nr:hypothetical protein [Clostridiaceae bacterium]